MRQMGVLDELDQTLDRLRSLWRHTMSDLTREEIRRACEAVGWEVTVSDGLSGRVFWALDPTGPGWERFQHCMDLAPPGNRWLTPAREDALALLEALGEPLSIERHQGKHGNHWWEVAIRMSLDGMSAKGFGEGPDLPTAAVRAVNQATEGEGHE